MKRNNRALSIVERNMEAARLTQPILPSAEPVQAECFAHLQDLPANIEVAPGTVLVEQGQSPKAVSILCRGLVRLICIGPDGRQTTLGLRTSGWYAGAVQVIMNTPSPYTVVAVTECSLSRVPAGEFSLRLAQNATMMQHFVAVLCNEVSAHTGTALMQTACDTPGAFPARPDSRPASRTKAPQTESGGISGTTPRSA